jgi:hypothetical protein
LTTVVPEVPRSLVVLNAHAAMLNRLPPGGDGQAIAFHEHLLVARGALDQPAVKAQRDAPAFAGHAGWDIGTTAGLDASLPPQERFATRCGYERLMRQPRPWSVLVLPLGAQVQLGGERVTRMRLADGTTLEGEMRNDTTPRGTLSLRLCYRGVP